MRVLSTRRRRIAALSVLLAMVMAGTAVAATFTQSARTLGDVELVAGQDATTTNSVNWVTVPNAVARVTIPAGRRGIIRGRFTAESACTGAAGNWCSVRILVNGQEANPVVGQDFAFDSVGDDRWESHSVARSRGYYGAGTYRVVVQYAVTSPNVTHRVDDWLFEAEALLT